MLVAAASMCYWSLSSSVGSASTLTSSFARTALSVASAVETAGVESSCIYVSVACCPNFNT